MSGVHHLSMRVPWRDRQWDQFVCDDPLGNSSCTLLSNIGRNRDDTYENAHGGHGIDTLDPDKLPCLSERATFMSPLGYTVTKKHPYAWNPALEGHLHPSPVHVPPYAFEAIPYRWLNRKQIVDEVGLDRVPGFNPAAEDAVDTALHFDGANWVMDGNNQRAAINAFFNDVSEGHSLVFTYLKHSPLQEERTDRLLLGAARVSRVTPPPMWTQTGRPPFTSSMWETTVEHTLRPDMTDGVLLPYQALIPLQDQGVDITDALAWAPEGRDVEFSYVTEHLSDDAALEALAALEHASHAMQTLGVPIPDSALDWLTAQTERLWQVRGPVPGLAGVFAVLGVEEPFVAARTIIEHVNDTDPAADGNPWPALEQIFADLAAAAEPYRSLMDRTIATTWKRLPARARDVFKLLSTFDISADQVRMLIEGNTEVELKYADLLDNPYWAVICTFGQDSHIPFSTVDRAMFPPQHVSWHAPIPDAVRLDSPRDRRRIEALLTHVLERRGRDGDTVLTVGETLEAANALELSRPPNLNHTVLIGTLLDHDALAEAADAGTWSPLLTTLLTDGTHAYKLSRYEDTSNVIRDAIDEQLARPRLGALVNARAELDNALDRNRDVVDARAGDPLEERGRQEKAAGLSVLHDSPLSVLIGPAGTGKTTLLRALVDQPGIIDGGVLLLAPTGKARVQLETKVGRPAQTLAGYLARTGRYEFETGRYVVAGEHKRRSYSLVVIDESSMLTEEMLAATLDTFTGVTRLVLVGDPRQLPPIGAGRPFVDLVNRLRPDTFDDWIHAADSYVELQITRRQMPDGGHGTRHDLELAAWFGDDSLGAADDAVWAELAANRNQASVRYEPWGDRTVLQALTDVMSDELGLDHSREAADLARAFALTYGATVNGQWTNWEPGAGAKAEAWQILSPTRSRAFGTGELNRHLKRTYRGGDTRFAQRTARSNIAAPYGPELIVRGDKVMQTENDTRNAYPATGGLNYIANGEIGVAIGRTVPSSKRAKSKLWLDVEFSSQPGFTYGYRPTKADTNIKLELAWAVTVHKSQGSEFGTTFLILPRRTNSSRELLYTALTRQRERVVIVHEGTLEELRMLAAPWRSETARRLTDLFAMPTPVTLTPNGTAIRYDRNLMHVSAAGIPMASKNEVIIAGLLDRLAPGRWTYEEPFTGSDGRTVKPDFTVMTRDGRKIFWEHAGMLDLPDYARKWELKKDWYSDNGVLPESDGGGTNGTLFWTESTLGADAQHWLSSAAAVLGVDPDSANERDIKGSADPSHRRAAKKTPRRPR